MTCNFVMKKIQRTARVASCHIWCRRSWGWFRITQIFECCYSLRVVFDLCKPFFSTSFLLLESDMLVGVWKLNTQFGHREDGEWWFWMVAFYWRISLIAFGMNAICWFNCGLLWCWELQDTFWPPWWSDPKTPSPKHWPEYRPLISNKCIVIGWQSTHKLWLRKQEK